MTDPKPAQRDVMRILHKEHGGIEAAVVAAYAKAELDGRVDRRSNKSDMDAIAYARALFRDGHRPGRAWLL